MRVAIIGLGHAGAGLHLPALKGISAVRVVGGCDLTAESRQRAATQFHIPVFEDPDVMLAETTPDVVVVATPPTTHAEECIRALRYGAHVVCEKPFVSSLADADRVIAAAAAAGRQVAVNHEFREMPIFRSLIDRTREVLGGVRFVQVWQLMNMPPSSEKGWRGQIAERTLFEAGVHLVDLVMALLGEKPIAVQATTSTGSGEPAGAEALVLASLEFRDGRLAQIVQNRICKGEPQYLEARVDTRETSFRASFGGRARVSAGLFRSTRPHIRIERGTSGIAWREDGVRRTQLARNPAQPNMLATRAILTDALQAFQLGTPPRISAAYARDVLQVIAASYTSARTGRRVHLDGPHAAALAELRMGEPSTAAR